MTINAYARELGIDPRNEGWKLVKIGEADVRGEKEFTKVEEILYKELSQWPIWPLPLEFADPNSNNKQTVKFTEKPLGIQFSNKAPIKVDKVYDESPAKGLGVKEGWVVTKIAEVDIQGSDDFKDLRSKLGEGVKPLDYNNKTYQLAEGITGYASNQDGNNP